MCVAKRDSRKRAWSEAFRISSVGMCFSGRNHRLVPQRSPFVTLSILGSFSVPVAVIKVDAMTEPAKKPYFKKIASNRRAHYNYFIEEYVEAGIELHGSEVKSLRLNNVSFADCYAVISEGQCWVIGLQITTYEKTHVQIPDPVRRRRLLLSRREIEKLQKKVEMTGRTLVPLEIYFKGAWAKMKLGICRGKKFSDRREDLKSREATREIDRAKKARRRA